MKSGLSKALEKKIVQIKEPVVVLPAVESNHDELIQKVMAAGKKRDQDYAAHTEQDALPTH